MKSLIKERGRLNAKKRNLHLFCCIVVRYVGSVYKSNIFLVVLSAAVKAKMVAGSRKVTADDDHDRDNEERRQNSKMVVLEDRYGLLLFD